MTTFNSAGFDPANYGLPSGATPKPLTHYLTKGEVLNKAQCDVPLLRQLITSPLPGEIREVEPVNPGGMVDKHGIDDQIDAMEAQKRVDETVLSRVADANQLRRKS